MKDSPNLDLLRSLAVSFVVMDHLRRPFFHWAGAVGQFFDSLGLLGVAIFFVHTTLVLMQSLERTGPAPIPFYVRRAFRIYPLAMLSACLGAWLVWVGHGYVDLQTFASNLLLMQNLARTASMPGPLWTLPYEVQMYVLLPFLFLVTRFAFPVRWIAGFWLAAVAVVLALYASGLAYFPLRFIPCFLPGIVAYVLGKRAARHGPWLLFALVGLGVLSLPIVLSAHVPLTAFVWTFCAVLGFTIPLCRQIASPVLSRCAKVVATYSYGIYLTHTVIIGIAFNGFAHAPLALQIAVFVGLMVGVPYAAYRFLEAPGIALGKSIAERLRAVRIQPATLQ
jgi:peptidoglycan/LPS O-acetylase OafA/YrhL